MNEDVKDLLSRAFGQEPPLAIDRDTVLQQGRKRLRRRRLFEAGSVVALVVVVAVGAATLTRLVTMNQDRMPPAASSVLNAPPGPDLPLVPYRPTVSPTTTHVPLTADIASAERQLTSLLYAAGVIDDGQAARLPGQDGPPRFNLKADQFVYEADLYRTPSERGFVQVVVDPSPSVLLDCGHLSAATTEDCEVKYREGVPLTVARFFDNGTGERTIRVSAVYDNGVSVSATATNMTREDRKAGSTQPKFDPVLSGDDLCVLVAKVGVVG